MTSSAGEVKKLEHKLKHLGEEGATAAKIVASLKAAHSWIADEESFFGKVSSRVHASVFYIEKRRFL